MTGTWEFLSEADAVLTQGDGRGTVTFYYLTRWPEDSLGLAAKGLSQVWKDNSNMTSSGPGGPDRIRKIFREATPGGAFTFFYQRGVWKQTILVASNNSHVVVAFRGSDSDLMVNKTDLAQLNSYIPDIFGLRYDSLKLHDVLNGTEPVILGIPGPWEKFGECPVHHGWSDAANHAYDLIVPEMTKQGAANKTIIITGHSMGGAVAGYFTYRLMRDTELLQGKRAHELVTFAAPRYAAEGFYGKFNDLATKKSLSVTSIEIVGDTIPFSWESHFATDFAFGQKIGVLGIFRLGRGIDLWTPADEKHGADNYFHSLATSKLNEYVVLKHKGAYVARFFVSWVRPDGVAGAWNSGRKSVGETMAVPVPRGATKVHLKVEVDVVFGAYRTVFDEDVTVGSTYVAKGVTSYAPVEKE